jgi:murein DD-endopeptidase MepM/ murein hydrolase activator NlpD
MFRISRKSTKRLLAIGGIILIVLAGFVFWEQLKNKANDSQSQNVPNVSVQSNSSDVVSSNANTQAPPTIVSTTGFAAPISRASERVTKKPFGIYITKQNSPVQPERFQGYHTGTDFETFPEELNQDVPISTICSGKIKAKEWATGYGGVLVQDCSYDNQPITIIYGHLNLASISKNIGDNLNAGDVIGILGNAYSRQTDGERKHLHLGIHKGSTVNILGYVQNQSQLDGWYNACDLGVCQ